MYFCHAWPMPSPSFAATAGRSAYVRVAFEDSDYAAIPSTNKMAARVAAMGESVHSAVVSHGHP